MIRRILVGIADASHTESATRHALDVASVYGASVSAVSVIDSERIRQLGAFDHGVSTILKQERLTKAEQTIDACFELFERLCREAGVEACRKHEYGDPLKSLINDSRYYDLMVFGLSGLIEHGLMTEPPDELAKLLSSGVHPILAVGSEYRQIGRILIAYSGSIESAHVVRLFAQLSSLWGRAAVRIVHFARKSDDQLLPAASEYLKEYGFAADSELVEGSPMQLLDYAKQWKADMIVLGNSSKTLLKKKIFGEAALHTIKQSSIPLFLSQ